MCLIFEVKLLTHHGGLLSEVYIYNDIYIACVKEIKCGTFLFFKFFKHKTEFP